MINLLWVGVLLGSPIDALHLLPSTGLGAGRAGALTPMNPKL